MFMAASRTATPSDWLRPLPQEGAVCAWLLAWAPGLARITLHGVETSMIPTQRLSQAALLQALKAISPGQELVHQIAFSVRAAVVLAPTEECDLRPNLHSNFFSHALCAAEGSGQVGMPELAQHLHLKGLRGRKARQCCNADPDLPLLCNLNKHFFTLHPFPRAPQLWNSSKIFTKHAASNVGREPLPQTLPSLGQCQKHPRHQGQWPGKSKLALAR